MLALGRIFGKCPAAGSFARRLMLLARIDLLAIDDFAIAPDMTCPGFSPTS